MSTLLWIAWTNLRRDRVAQALTFLLPIVFFSIFANVFGRQGGTSTAKVRIAASICDSVSAEMNMPIAMHVAPQSSSAR